MTRTLGYSALVVALALTPLGMLLAAWGARRGRAELVRTAYAVVYTNFGLYTIATAAMVYGLVARDFSISYVAQVGSHATPLFYTVISLWGALEGSILFWGWVLALYGALVVYLNRDRAGALVPYAAAALLGVALFFSILLVAPANPFRLVWPPPPDGPGPNPLLQNHPLMAVHPPLLYLGYVGMSVPFAFAVGALLARESGGDWLRMTRRWTITAWIFLTAAIVAGMWWSYEVLGWGGYWVWDPVENASFMPWLTATAFLHSMMVEERRGLLRVWNLSLIVATFLLTILGTFLTRSGVLSSVHAFTQGTIGYYFLVFIAVVLVFSLALLAGRSAEFRGSAGALDAAASRETVFLLNNLVLTAFTFTVLLGTLFPLVAEAARGTKLSVGAPFFNRMTLPLCMALLFLVGVGPALPWRRASRSTVRRQLLPPAIAFAVVVVAALALMARDGVSRSPYAVLAFGFGAFALTANLREFWTGARARRAAHGEPLHVALTRLVASNRRRYGGYVAHVGAVVTAVAIAASSTFRAEHERTLRPGETMAAGRYRLRLDSLWARPEPQRFVIGAEVAVLDGGRRVGRMDPRMNFYRTTNEPVPTPAVRSRPAGDLYVNLMAFERDGSSATLRAIVEPLVPWIWTGGGIIVLGALLAVWPARRGARAYADEPMAAAREAGGAGARGAAAGERYGSPVPVRTEPVRQGTTP